MTQLAEGWDIVSRRTNKPLRHLLGIFLQMVMMAEPMTFSSVTWTVRETATGTVRKVTAQSEQEARAMIKAGLFDEA